MPERSSVIMRLLLILLILHFSGGGSSAPGERQMLVVHETADSSPAMANEILALRSGAHEAYLKEKGHVLDIPDDEKPAPILDKFKPYALPEVLIILPPDKVLAREPFTTADAAMDLLKRNGG
jgi:hypothetical protein